ncbi:MAG: hypothetical protein ACHREM_01630 [Polyangiales bacterium]
MTAAAACVPCMFVGADPSPATAPPKAPATIDPVTIEFPTLGHGFYAEVAKLGSRHRTNPAIFLNVWCAESGLDPSAMNPGGARGLNQMQPQTLAFFKAPADFEKLTGIDQLPWIERFITWTESLNHGPFTSAARCYAANFWPASLARPDAPSSVIVDRDSVDTSEAAAYAKNKGLDTDGDGKITLRDLATHLARVRRDYSGAFDLLAQATAQLHPSLVTWPTDAATDAAMPPPRVASVRVGRDAAGFVASLVVFGCSIVAMNRARGGR